MNIVLIGGFLGSGKTTFIKQWAAYLIKQQKRTVIVENEAGEVGIDDQFLAMEGFQVKEIMGGCICCTLTAELTVAVNSLEETFHPDWLLVETTGIAKPATVIETLKKYGKGISRIYTIILVDTGRWPELMEIMPELITTQVAAADLILANKIDEIEPEVSLEQVLAGIRSVNAQARLIPMAAADGIDEELLKELCQIAGSDHQNCQA